MLYTVFFFFPRSLSIPVKTANSNSFAPIHKQTDLEPVQNVRRGNSMARYYWEDFQLAPDLNDRVLKLS